MWWKVLCWAGAVAVLAGVVAGFSPLSSGGGACGSVFGPANRLLEPAGCPDVRNVLAIPVRVLLIGGALALVIGGNGAHDAWNRRRLARRQAGQA